MVQLQIASNRIFTITSLFALVDHVLELTILCSKYEIDGGKFSAGAGEKVRYLLFQFL